MSITNIWSVSEGQSLMAVLSLSLKGVNGNKERKGGENEE
jgi:hypothetical protein